MPQLGVETPRLLYMFMRETRGTDVRFKHSHTYFANVRPVDESDDPIPPGTIGYRLFQEETSTDTLTKSYYEEAFDGVITTFFF